jgi:molybdopterin adenylyltransferase
MFNFAIITVSTKGYAGNREDTSGPAIKELIKDFGTVVELVIVPDEQEIIESNLIRLADILKVDAIFTTGGTGFSPTDVTPEATLAVISKLVPGIPEAMRLHSMQFTIRAMLTRSVAGIRGKTLIINLPGSKKAVVESLEVVLPNLEHALTTMRGQTIDCAR